MSSGDALPTLDGRPRDTRFPTLEAAGVNVTPEQCFYAFITPEMINEMFRSTASCMPRYGKKLTIGEMHQFLGVLWALNSYRGKKRSELWSRKPATPISQGINIGEKTGMGFRRYKTILKAFRVVPLVRDEAQVRCLWRCFQIRLQSDPWVPLRAFIDSVNQNLAKVIIPGRDICIDESIFFWYGDGLPAQVKIKRFAYLFMLCFIPAVSKPRPIGAEAKCLAECTYGCIIQLEIQVVYEVCRRRRVQNAWRPSHGVTVATSMQEQHCA